MFPFDLYNFFTAPFIWLVWYKLSSWSTTRAWLWHGNLIPFPFRSSREELIPVVKTQDDSQLTWKHHLYVTFNRMIITPIYFYHVYKFFTHESTTWVDWDINITSKNLLNINSWWYIGIYFIQFVLLFLIYDFNYYFFHRFLHLRAVYPYVHKHHHSIISAFRGTYDGADTHPFEMVVGIYIHLWALLILKFFFVDIFTNIGVVSGYAFVAFKIFAGLFNSLNHTRFGVEIPYFYDSRDHDIHHRMLTTNYATGVMYWDKLFGTYCHYYEPKTVKRQRNLNKKE